MAIKYSKLSSYKIKKIVQCFCADLTAEQTSLICSLNRNTINRYYQIFRTATYKKQLEDLYTVLGRRPDEAYLNVSENIPKPQTHHSIFGIFEHNSKVYTETLPAAKQEILRKVMREKESLDSILSSEDWIKYSCLVDVGSDKCIRINKSNSFSDKENSHADCVESFWSFTKRRLAKFNGVKTYFSLHLKECEWRWKRSQQELELELWKLILKSN